MSFGRHLIERLSHANLIFQMYPVDRLSIHIWNWQAINESEALALRRQSPLRLFLSQIGHSCLGHKDEVVFDQCSAHFDTELFSLVLVVYCLNLDDQRVFDAEDRIRRLIWIIFEV